MLFRFNCYFGWSMCVCTRMCVCECKDALPLKYRKYTWFKIIKKGNINCDIIKHAEALKRFLHVNLRTWPTASIMDPAELCPGGSEFLPGNCYTPYERAVSDMIFSHSAQLCRPWCQLCPLEGNATIGTIAKWVFLAQSYWIRKLTAGRWRFQLRSQIPLLDFSVKYTHHSHG